MATTTEFVWQDRKRPFLGLPWSFTQYCLTEKKLLIRTGFLNRTEDEIRLYRIMDVTLHRSLGERLLGIGTIHCCSGDKTSPEFELRHIRNPSHVKELLSDLVEEERRARRVGTREYMDMDNEPEHEEID